jgi:hypothetical protein
VPTNVFAGRSLPSRGLVLETVGYGGIYTQEAAVGFRVSKRIKVAPGLSFRVNTKSVSMTAGGKRARYTVNSKGRRTASVSMPGTGISY